MARSLLIGVALSIILSQSGLVGIGEELRYSASFKSISVGDAIIRTNSTLDNEIVISTSIKSNRFLSRFYSLDDSISTIYSNDFNLKRIYKRVSQGTYKKTFISDINTIEKTVATGSVVNKFTYDPFDPIGLICFLRSAEITSIENDFFSIIDNGKITDIGIYVSRDEGISIGGSQYSCIKFVPYSIGDEKLFKNDGIMSVWVTDDRYRVPIKIEQRTNIGMMTLELKGIGSK